MAFSTIPEELKQDIFEKIAIYKLRMAFAKALLGYLVRNLPKCYDCNLYKSKNKYCIVPICADSRFMGMSCCTIHVCQECNDYLPLQCGHKILEEEYEPETFDSRCGYYEHAQMCKVCHTQQKVSRPWCGLTPSGWEDRY